MCICFLFILNESLGKGNVKESQTPVTSFTCHRSTSLLFISGQWQQKIWLLLQPFFFVFRNTEFWFDHLSYKTIDTYKIYHIYSHCKLFHLALVHKYLSYFISFNCILWNSIWIWKIFLFAIYLICDCNCKYMVFRLIYIIHFWKLSV